MAQRDSRTSAYPGLASFSDPTQQRAIKLMLEKIARLEQMNTRLQDEIDARPTLAVSPDEMKAFVLQQIATLRSVAADPTYPVAPGVPGEPNVIPDDALPLPAHAATVAAVFAANPAFVATSCQDAAGGTWDLMDAIVDALRARDTRWGYNGKRGNINDPSEDALAYDFNPAGAGGEGSTTVYIVDVIAGHCGPSPSAAFQDVTVFAPGVWTGRGRF